jgi:hypothetical protein
MVSKATFNNISVISWQSVLLVEETRVTGETTDLPQVTEKINHIILYRIHLTWTGFELTTSVVIGTDCIGSYKFNYHTITTTTAQSISIVHLNIQCLWYEELYNIIILNDTYICFSVDTKPESKVLRRSKELRSKLGHMTLSEITTMLYDNIVYNKGR